MKNLKNLGKALTKAEQKTINGGLRDGSFPGDVSGPGNNPCGFMTCMNQFGRCQYCSFDEWYGNEWGN